MLAWRLSHYHHHGCDHQDDHPVHHNYHHHHPSHRQESDPLYCQAVIRGGGEGVQLLVDGEDHLPQGVEVAKDVET